MSKDMSMTWVEYIKANGQVVRSKERVVMEFGLTIIINNEHLTTAMITPLMEEEFIVGHLFTQSIIQNVSDIKSINISNSLAEIKLFRMQNEAESLPMVNSDFKVSHNDIFQGVKAILKSSIFAETEAVHSAGLFRLGAEPVCIAEDIGRHNALDKIIGYGLLHNIDFGHTFVTSTGRQPSEMILKCCKANIPVIATKGVPTTLAIDIAQTTGFTIVGMVRGTGMIIYSNPARIE